MTAPRRGPTCADWRRPPPRAGDVVHARAGGPGLRLPVGDDGSGSDRRDRRARRRIQHPATSPRTSRASGITPPSVTAVSVDGGQNSPGTDPNADGEVMLDIEVVGAVAPAAAIVVYFAPNTDQGFIDAVSTAVHDSTHKPSVVSVSWGESEDAWSAQARTQMEQILTEAGRSRRHGHGGRRRQRIRRRRERRTAARRLPGVGAARAGLRRHVAAGLGGNDPVGDRLERPRRRRHRRRRQPPVRAAELPGQRGVPVNVDTQAAGRGVPDVSGNADPQTGYQIRVDGAERGRSAGRARSRRCGRG